MVLLVMIGLIGYYGWSRRVVKPKVKRRPLIEKITISMEKIGAKLAGLYRKIRSLKPKKIRKPKYPKCLRKLPKKCRRFYRKHKKFFSAKFLFYGAHLVSFIWARN